MDKPVTLGGVATYDIKDEDTMASDGDRALATQQSIKAYADSLRAGRGNMQELTVSGTVTPGINAIELSHAATTTVA